MRVFVAAFLSWLPLGAAITGVCLLLSITVQQTYRQGLNDPQIQMAEDEAAQLDKGISIDQIVPIGSVGRVDLAQSLAPWIGVYDETGKPLASSGVLGGSPPHPPLGVFNDTKNGLGPLAGHHLTVGWPANENRVSWQPNPNVRQATVVVYVPEKKEFVVAGRNMREVEEREGNLGLMVFLAWSAIIITTFILKLFVHLVKLT